ncbi:DUF4271 domain-containing protein [Bergeyella sp. RCAD1439]|uniref:DUF4271 domain-containing protein n=1 Tax=Bergeyella anatis TaxID=3113737 RepID=UPI002E16E815|nr:DUF4271 domain-containing protein [Bergeyella sp. RCAD1439]
MVRLTENNDWVVWVLLGVIVVFIVVLQYLQREAGLREFFTQNFIDSGNIFPTYLLISGCYMLLLTTLLSKYIPILPQWVEAFSVSGYSLNKFGFTFLAVLAFYLVKFFFSFVFYSSIGQDTKWGKFYFVSSKFYLALSFILMAVVFTSYYLPVDQLFFLRALIISSLAVFVFKILFFYFNKNRVLPKEWYYKILYICTLQFAPLLALGKLLFY